MHGHFCRSLEQIVHGKFNCCAVHIQTFQCSTLVSNVCKNVSYQENNIPLHFGEWINAHNALQRIHYVSMQIFIWCKFVGCCNMHYGNIKFTFCM